MSRCAVVLQSLLLLYYLARIASSSSSEGEVNLTCRRYVPIALNLTLLPLANIVALSGGNDDPNFPVQNIGSRNSGWCASNATDISNLNYINLTFTEPVLLGGIDSFGRFTTTEHFVSNFSILYTLLPESSEPLQLYDKHFTATSPSREYYITREAIIARQLQFRINEYGRTDTFFCWGLFLLGCTLDNTDVITTSACPINSAVMSSTALIPNTTIPLTTSSTIINATATTSSCPAIINMTSLVIITSTLTLIQSPCELAFTSTTLTSAIGGVAGLVLLVGVVLIVSAIILCITTLATRRKRISVDVINLDERRPTLAELENHALYEREREDSMINNQLYKSTDGAQHHLSTLYESVEEANNGSKMVHSMSDLDHPFQCRYTEVTVDNGVTTITENTVATGDADNSEHDSSDHQVSDHKLVLTQANVPVSSDAATVYANVPAPSDNIIVYENIAYASSRQS